MTESMIERVARALCAAAEEDWSAATFSDTANGCDPEEMRSYWRMMACAAIEAIDPDNDAFVHAVGERMHDARFSASGETYPVVRSFIRALKDAALNEQVSG